MTDTADLFMAPLIQVAEKIKSREVSPVELTEAMLARISTLNVKYKAYTTITAELALTQAKEAEADISRGNYKGPLHGIPVAVKDLFATKGIRTTVGSVACRDRVSDRDAFVVERLHAAGAVLLGKLNMTEFALSGYHPDLAAPINPWGEDRWAGVSSSGSGVAAATGMAFGTLGTDTGGSIRFPSAANGVVGIKPSYGRVSTHGAFPLAVSLDHVGPITRRVADAAAMLQAIAGYDPRDAGSWKSAVPDFSAGIGKGVKGLRVGIDRAYVTGGTHPEIASAVIDAVERLARLGAEIVEVDIGGVVGTASWWHPVMAVEALAAHRQAGLWPQKADAYGTIFRAALEDGEKFAVLGVDVAKRDAKRATAVAQAILDQAFAQVDVIACPSGPLPAMLLAEFPPNVVQPPSAVVPFLGFTAPYNFTGVPTISLPCGFTSEKLPASLQLIGPRGGEAVIIQVADAYEQATDWHNLVPPIH